MGGHLEFFSNINFEFYKSDKSDLYRINGAETTSVNKNIIQNLELMEEGYKIIHLLNKFTEDKYPLPKVLKLSNASFYYLNAEKNTKLVLLTFKIKFFTILGYLPSFDHCLKCREKLTDSQNYFDFSNLGIECSNCLSEIAITKAIPFPLIKTINFIQKGSFEQIMKVSLQRNDLLFLLNLAERIIENIAER